MKVKDVMTRDLATCAPHTDLAQAVWKMWEMDCGAMPVLSDSKLVGLITDRDIATAVGTRDRLLRDIKVGEVISGEVHACHMDDDLDTALSIMGREQMRHLPVVDDEETLRGIVSMNDLFRMNRNERAEAVLSAEDVLSACGGISKHRRGVEPVKQVATSSMPASAKIPKGQPQLGSSPQGVTIRRGHDFGRDPGVPRANHSRH